MLYIPCVVHPGTLLDKSCFNVLPRSSLLGKVLIKYGQKASPPKKKKQFYTGVVDVGTVCQNSERRHKV